jgi:hypothetical protein
MTLFFFAYLLQSFSSVPPSSSGSDAYYFNLVSSSVIHSKVCMQSNAMMSKFAHEHVTSLNNERVSS